MSIKYPEYTKGNVIPMNMRICNVVYCIHCKREFLLGETINGVRPDEIHNVTFRKKPTLIIK